jgi:RNase P/RNase MRP subunit p29
MTQTQRDNKLIYLRQWVGERVQVVADNQSNYTGRLTNIVFDGTRLMYVLLDDVICLNFDHVVEIRLEK